MANFKETKDYTFAKLCKTYGGFEIPIFQRPYSWKNKNLQDFFNSIIENDKQYFIGNIVAVGHEPLKIIDGQQRLTSISLLLAVIRDLYLEIDWKNETEKQISEQRDESINAYLFNKDLDAIPARVYSRLCLGKEKYQNIYKKIIERKISEIDIRNLGDNEKRILSNYNILKKLVSNYIQASKLNRLEEILEKVISLQIILIECSNDNEIYKIFEGFNSTGLGLSVADLIKNAVLMQANKEGEIQNNVETLWLSMEGLFESTSVGRFPKFLRHQYISENGYILMSNLFSAIKEEKIKNRTPNDILDYVSRLEQEAKIYSGMIYEEYQKNLELDKEMLDEFKKFRLLRNDQVYEILLAYYKAYKNNKIRKSSLQKYLKKLWIFVLRSRFISINPSEYETIFANHCKNISACDGPEEFSKYFDIFIDKLKKLVKDDLQFIDNFVSDVSFEKDNKLIKEVLLEIMSHDNGNILINKPEIEHILPQEPRKWNLTKTITRDYVNKIGNLTLLFGGDNRVASNGTFDEKIPVYINTRFLLNEEVASIWGEKFKNDWKSAIDDRGKNIAEKISKIWKL